MKTVTEKYHAVNEGAMSKAEFVRQIRLAHPQLISQFNGFNDSVQILKNKGLLFEKKEENEYENPSYNLSPDAVRRGVRYELLLAGLDPAGDISEEDYTKAHKKAEDNIMKDQLHYYRMIADDKTKIEHDKMKETKRGAQETDTDNAMAKVKLNENVNKKQLIRESVESCVRAIRSKYPDDGEAMISAFIKMHKNDIAGMTPKECVAEYEEYRTVNLDSLDETESSINERVGALQDFISLIQDRAAETGFTELEEAEEVLEAIADHYGMSLEIRHIDVSEPNENKLEAKGKDHDGDGDIDSDDYMAAKDKAIKKAMGKDINEAEEKIKRALKKKIVQILNEGSLNEAATNQLADLANQYAGFDGMKGAILDLQNIVTDIESYYDKTRGKIQRVYDTLGEIRNEEGLKVGAFIAPAVESAFNKDLRPVVKDGFTKGLDTPKVRTLSQADIDAAGGGDLEEKQTVFNENKKTK
jgi:hypothetical protein